MNNRLLVNTSQLCNPRNLII